MKVKAKPEFFKAAKTGDLKKLGEYLDANPDAIHAWSGGMQAIHWAAEGNQPAAIDLLLSRGADIDCQMVGNKSTAVSWAIYKHSLDALHTLVRHGANLDLLDFWGKSALGHALGNPPEKRDQVVLILVEAGAKYGLSEAVTKGDLPTVRKILEKNPDALHEKCQHHITLLQSLVIGRFEGETPDHVEIFKLLMAHGWKVPKDDLNYFVQGCANSNRPLLAKVILDNAEQMSDTPEPPAKKPKKTKAKVIPPIETLCKAIRDGDLAECKKLLKADKNLMSLSHEGMEPILHAAESGHTEILKLLLDSGADIEALSEDDETEGRTPLHFAAEKGTLDSIRLLIDRGADVNATDYLEATPMELAIRMDFKERKEIVKMLKKAGAKK